MVAGFYATTRLPLTDSTAISFTAPLFMILTAIFLLGETVRWRRGLATLAGIIGVLVMVRPDSGTLDVAAAVGGATVLVRPTPSAWKAMHQQPPHTPLCLSTNRAKSGHVVSSRGFTLKPVIVAPCG
jgi:drug/metabolite transporter (DMT)-like permease